MLDPRLCCKFCLNWESKYVSATRIAPQHTGGDEDIPATWVPVCEEHYKDWDEGVADDDTLPSYWFSLGVVIK